MSYKKLTTTPPGEIKEINTDAEMTAVLTAENVGKCYKFTGTTGTYVNGDLYVIEYNPLAEPLCFTANTAGSIVTLNKNGRANWTGSYSTDGATWTTYEPGTTGAITLTNIGDKVYFKGDITADFNYSSYLNFSMAGSIAASGNINSMYISTGFENLTTLTYRYCYAGMFRDCTNLTTAPILPATSLAPSCYFSMFSGCSSLTTAPALPATTLATSCYSNMFYGCTSLQVNDSAVSGTAEQAWTIPTSGTFTSTSLQDGMFQGCAGTRSSDNMAGQAGQSYTYYTQNQPI